MTSSAAPISESSAPQVAADLPIHLTRFVGRTHELDELLRLLPGTRLLTLTGAGGSGKTRLARETAARIAAEFTRVGWVDLAPLGEASLVPREVANALHVAERSDAGRDEAIIASLGDTPTLLVLDNCEHVVDACASLVERLLRGAPRLTVLATSREALGVSSETAWLVPPLVGAEAVQLFVERAQASLPSFALSDNNADVIREICRRLDGIPLAIELAAARVKVLPPEQIAERLNDAFRLLTSGSRTALPRHRTLRGTMDWSYALLNEREQALLRRLSVFAGSFSLEAAEDVCAGDPLEAEDILDGVAGLVDKSLVVMESDEGAARYRLLETVRQYGREKLGERNELERWQERHARWFLAFAERIAPLLVGGEHESGLVARVGLEHDNLRAAAAWAAADPARTEEALRFADALFWYWYGTGYWFGTGQFREARDFVIGALARAGQVPPLLHGRALAAQGLIGLATGEWTMARDSLAASLALVRAHGERPLITFVLSKLGAAHIMLGEWSDATRVLDEACDLVRDVEPRGVLHSFAYSWRGWVAHATGDLARARELFEACYQIGRATGHRTSLAHGSSFLGRVELTEGNRNEAFVRFSYALMLHLDIGDGWGLQLDLEGLAAIAVGRGRDADGARLMGAVDALRERVSVALPATDHAERARLATIARERLGAAFDGAYDEGRRMSMDDVVRLVGESVGAETAEYRIPVEMLAPEPVEPTPAAVAPLRVLALGPLQVIVNGTAIESGAWGSARPRELLVYLLLHPEGRTKEQVGLDFWPDASTEQLRNNFHVTLHRLRKALGASEWITLVGDRYRLVPDVLREFDAAEFEREVMAARKALKRKEEGASQLLERAVERYRGDLLDGEPAGDWHVDHRERLQRMYVDALMELGERLASEERHAKAADAFRRVLARDDLHEDAVRALMICHAKVGERAQALRLYQRFTERLAKELEAEPDDETTELSERIQRGTM